MRETHPSQAELLTVAVREATHEIRGSAIRQGGKKPAPGSFWAGALDVLEVLRPAWQRAGEHARRDVPEGADKEEWERARAERYAAVLPVTVDQAEQVTDASAQPADYRHGARWAIGHLRYVLHSEANATTDRPPAHEGLTPGRDGTPSLTRD